jgi:hypothetical protein
MDKNKVVALSDYTFEAISKFYKIYRDENSSSSFSDWNAKDVIGHILFWVDFSCRKLDCIKNNKPFNDISDLNKTNNETYEKNKNMSINILRQKTANAFFQYKDVVNLYNDNELLSKTFPTGFLFELWRYMVMDVYIHPMRHLLHYYLKTDHYNEFTNETNNIIGNFLEYSNNDINVFQFDEYYESHIEKIKQFGKLKEKNIHDKAIENIIKINME